MTIDNLVTADVYVAVGGIAVHRTIETIPVAGAIEPLIDALDAHRGILLASSYEYPGRYTRWDVGFADSPPAATTPCSRSPRSFPPRSR